MYRTNDKRSAILEVQKYLAEIYGEHEFLYLSGVFDDQTRRLVVKFQNDKQLTPTGTVDQDTFEKLYSEYKSSLIKKQIANDNRKFFSFPIKQGDLGEETRIINNDLSMLLDYYGIHHSIRKNTYFSAETAMGVKTLRKIMNLKDGTHIDEEFYYRMTLDLNSQNKI